MLGCTNNITAAILTKKGKCTLQTDRHIKQRFSWYINISSVIHIHIYSRTYKHTQMHTLTIPTIHKDFLEYEK